MAETRSRSVRIADDVWEAIQGLPGKTDDALRAILIEKKIEPWERMQEAVAEILELVRSLPDAEDVGESLRRVVAEMKAERAGGSSSGTVGDPGAIPGVGRGVQNLPARPFRETGSQRAERERRERQERARKLDSIDDESFDRSDEYVSG